MSHQPGCAGDLCALGLALGVMAIADPIEQRFQIDQAG